MKTVLVVDDAPDIRLLVRAILGRSGFHVKEASGGPDALAVLETDPLPDVVMLDLQMPVMDGWETLAAIRANPRLSHLPVILCTVRAHLHDKARAWRSGCDGYLNKPFSITHLVEEVETTIARTAEQLAAARRVRLSETPLGG